jgi:hypothetical protein
MARWDHTLKLADVFHNDALTLERKREIIADRIVKRLGKNDEFGEEFTDLAEELRNTDTVASFDRVWNDVYDAANYHRVWIETF